MCPTFSGRRKESEVSVGINSVPVFMSMFWPGTSPICFHKTLKNPNGPFKKDRDTHGDLFGRHVDYWQNKGRHFSSAKYDHSFSAVPGNCYKSEKVSNDTGQGKKFLGMIVNSKEMTISLPQKKLQSTNICVRICIRIQ